MASAFVLYLNDAHAAPALELIRRISQPSSKSLPHVTVRYPVRRANDASLAVYRSATLDHVELRTPGAFLPREGGEHPKTVFLECASDQLEALVYKPDYPDSVFHVTLYDGEPSPFSSALYEIVNRYRWGLHVDLMPQTRLSQITIGGPRTQDATVAPSLSSEAAELLARCSNNRLTSLDLVRLGVSERLDLVDRICRELHARLLPEDHKAIQPAWERVDQEPTAGQQYLWDDIQALDMNWLPDAGRRERQGFARARSLFLTPPEVANEMAHLALTMHGTSRPVDFGDPAIGNGIFFAALLAELGSRPVNSAIGIDVDQQRIASLNRRWSSRALRAVADNFLDHRPSSRRSLIMANPPYLRSQMLNPHETERWRSQIADEVGVKVDGRSDLFVYFVLAAHAWMAPGAVAGWVLPIEFMESQYGSALRNYLTSKVQLKRIHVYDRVRSRFENARVSSTVVLYKNERPLPGHMVQVTFGDSMLSPERSLIIRAEELARAKRWKPFQLANSTLALPLGPTEDTPVLADLFRVRRGIATGANSLFVLDDIKRRNLSVSTRWVKPVVPKSRFLSSTVIEGDDDGFPVRIPRHWLIDTDEDLSKIHAESPRFGEYLRSIEHEAMQRRLVQGRVPFYKQESISPPCFFFGYMARAGASRLPSRFFLNESRAVILNNYLGLYPVGLLKSALLDGTVEPRDVYPVLTELGQEHTQAAGRHYAAGLSKLEPSDLRAVTLGPAGHDLLETLRQTYGIGRKRPPIL